MKTRTRVAQGDEDAGGAEGRGQAQQRRTEGTVEPRYGGGCRRLQCGHGDLRVSLSHV